MPKQDDAVLELFKNDLQHHETLSTALSSLIQTTLRVSFLLNGAAIVAALSVYGAKGADKGFPIIAFGIAVLIWVAGLLASAIATGIYTWAQREFQVAAATQYRQRAKEHFGLSLEGGDADAARRGFIYRERAVRFWWASLAAFGVGALILVCRAFFASAGSA
jgi:hypothetical protein